MSLGVGLVLGASSGIGAALTRRLAPLTRRLHVAARRPVDCADLMGDVIAHQCDIRLYPQVENLLAVVAADAGDVPVDFVVNCVGVGFYAPLDDDYSHAWRDITETNLVGLANLLAVAYRTRPEIGTIVTVSSLAAHRVSRTAGNIMYTAAKAGARILVEDFRRRIRSEGRSMRVMSISPGFTSATDFDANFYRDAPDARADLFGTNGSLTPDDVARQIEYMLGTPRKIEINDFIVRPTNQVD